VRVGPALALVLLGCGKQASAPHSVAPVDASAGAGGGVACPAYADGVAQGELAASEITEASGLASSRKAADVIWVHNDSGDSARVFAATRSGKALGIFPLSSATAVDWEDMAIGPGPKAGESYLYLGDIGDNSLARANVRLYRVPEPKLDASAPGPGQTLSDVETFTLEYPDGAHNAETLLVDPKNGDVFIVVKSPDGVSPVFRAKAPLSNGATIVLEQVAELELGAGGSTTGGDISPSGEWIAIRTYGAARIWSRSPAQSVGEALAGTPCPLPLHAEPQGEALAFLADDSGYLTVSEGSNQPLYFFARQ